MSLPKTAVDYAKSAFAALMHEDYAPAQVYAILALAAATLESTSPPWPTEAKSASAWCHREWTDEEASIPPAYQYQHQHGDKPHRCVYTSGHEKTDPHYCRCGAEL